MDSTFNIIQGGMGADVSSWELARSVSMERQLGVISSTAIDHVVVHRLQRGCPHYHSAVLAFPNKDVSKRILEKYYVEGGIGESEVVKRIPMSSVTMSVELLELIIVSNFATVYLAKKGHNNPVGINLLTKIPIPILPSLYGAMIADVDVVIMGAGIPYEIPAILDKLSVLEKVEMNIHVVGSDSGDNFKIHFNPQDVPVENFSLQRPDFFPIVSSDILAASLLKRAKGSSIEGFIVEKHVAGGHNAPPRGRYEVNSDGEPIYGDRDEINIKRIRDLGKPFYMAGGYGSAGCLDEALSLGAAGVQVGTIFAFSKESGFMDEIKDKVVDAINKGDVRVVADGRMSPTGFPFKVMQLEGTLSDEKVVADRPKVCNQGYLRTIYKTKSGKLGYRCPSEPDNDFIMKGGDPADIVGRKCLCNALMSAADAATMQKGRDELEKYVVSSGDDLDGVKELLKKHNNSYTVKDALNYLLGK